MGTEGIETLSLTCSAEKGVSERGERCRRPDFSDTACIFVAINDEGVYLWSAVHVQSIEIIEILLFQNAVRKAEASIKRRRKSEQDPAFDLRFQTVPVNGHSAIDHCCHTA
ncbi:hypothetical protein BAR24_10535 [Gluconobacter oxydans]|nr:hypothetical protein BAR24_10535 [Gluconobacter oxydans]